MAATIYEVAEKSGFSISTVSRVLNGIPLHSEETRSRVLQVINDLKFQPHAMAQSLARRRAKTLGASGNLESSSLHFDLQYESAALSNTISV